jgi:hypothetical protein
MYISHLKRLLTAEETLSTSSYCEGIFFHVTRLQCKVRIFYSTLTLHGLINRFDYRHANKAWHGLSKRLEFLQTCPWWRIGGNC